MGDYTDDEYIEYIQEGLGQLADRVDEREILQKLRELEFNESKVIKFLKNKYKDKVSTQQQKQPQQQQQQQQQKQQQQQQKIAGGGCSSSSNIDNSLTTVLTASLESVAIKDSEHSKKVINTIENHIEQYISDDEIDTISTNNTTNENNHMTIVVAGHVDAGKSTLVGNLLYKLGNVSKQLLHKNEKESQEIGKSSFALAWVMDESSAEREHGVTMNIATKEFNTNTKKFTILDAPGHNDFISEMINGATQADVALLVIPAIEGEFESSISINAQTREHAILLKALGIDQIIIAVNKMDKTAPSWSKERYLYITSIMEEIFRDIKYNGSLRFIPISGLSGTNIVNVESNCKLLEWYTEQTLVQMLDEFKLPIRRIDKPFRGIITSIISETTKGYEVNATVIQGKLRTGRSYALSGSNIAIAKKITNSKDVITTVLNAGENGKVLFIDKSSGRSNDLNIKEGYVISKTPITKSYKQFKAIIATMQSLPIDLPLIPGTIFELFIHGEEVQCIMSQVYDYKSINTEIVKKPKYIPPSCTATVLINIIDRAISMELFTTCQSLGRFVLRAKGKTCCIGVISKLMA